MRKWIYLPVLVSLLFSCTRPRQDAAATTAFTTMTINTGRGTGSVEVADLNKDGSPDIVVALMEDSAVAVLLNDGKGKFTPSTGSPFPANKSPNDIDPVDVNLDGNLDLCIANTEVSELTVLLGDGQGKFQQAVHSPFSVHSRPHTHGITVGDFNGDGKPDLATDDWADNKILIIYGDGQGNFSGERSFPAGLRPYQRLRSGDFDKDGHADIITTNLAGNDATVVLGTSDGTFHNAPGSPFPCGNAPFGVAVGDLNADGYPDLAIADSPTITAEDAGGDGLWILLDNGAGGFTTMKGSPFQSGRSPSRVAIGDLNGDKVNDVAVTNYNDKSVTVFYVGDATVSEIQTLKAGRRPNGIAISDLNQDGKNDIVVGNYDDGTLIIYLAK